MPTLKELNSDLLAAAGNNNVESLRTLLRQGADLRATDINGRTAIHIAILRSDYGYSSTSGKDIIPLFLNRGLDINTADLHGATVLHYAVQDETSYSVGPK